MKFSVCRSSLISLPLPLQGFDIDYFPGMVSWHLITPVVGEDLNGEFYRKLAQRAVDHYNEDKQVGWLFSLNLQ